MDEFEKKLGEARAHAVEVRDTQVNREQAVKSAAQAEATARALKMQQQQQRARDKEAAREQRERDREQEQEREGARPEEQGAQVGTPGARTSPTERAQERELRAARRGAAIAMQQPVRAPTRHASQTSAGTPFARYSLPFTHLPA